MKEEEAVEGAIDGSEVVVDMLLSFMTILATGNEVVRRVIEDYFM